jgi:hypothetical protein
MLLDAQRSREPEQSQKKKSDAFIEEAMFLLNKRHL